MTWETEICKRRAAGSKAAGVEEMAMHRKLSEFVTDAFAAKAMRPIMASMMQTALEVSPRPLVAKTGRIT